jgi:hypothetical protein
VTNWNEKPALETEGGMRVTRATVTQVFQGPVDGVGTVEYVMAHRPDKTASFVGLLHIKGSIGGRSGEFVLQSTGTFDGTTARGTWSVVPNMGSGDLKGLNGMGGFEAPLGPDGNYSLNYNVA